MRTLFAGLTAFLLLSCVMTPGAAQSEVTGQTLKYSAGGVEMDGYLAYNPEIKGKRPGVLVVHEWWGLNDYARMRARMLAEMGYAALAVDMYGGDRVAAHPEDAQKFSSELMKNFDVAKARFMAAMEALKKQPFVDPARIAAIGYCFGGGVVLNMARQGVDLRGAASFHGTLAAVKQAVPGTIKAKVLVLNGAADKFTTPEQLESFRKEMTEARADFRIISYPGAMHSFTNPDADEMGRKFNMPLGYNAEADKKSWQELTTFLKNIFGK